MTELDELIAAVEAGTLTFPEAEAYGHHSGLRYADVWSAYHGSLDAAKALHEAVLGGEWAWWFEPFREIAFCGVYNPNVSSMPITVGDLKPARAWLLTILKAMRARQ